MKKRHINRKTFVNKKGGKLLIYRFLLIHNWSYFTPLNIFSINYKYITSLFRKYAANNQ
jgi:hypothetical protein